MHHSWSRFTLGFIAGAAAISLAAAMPEYWYLAIILLYLSIPLLIQAARAKIEEKPFTSDGDEWRALGREFVQGIGPTLVTAAVAMAAILLVNELASRYPQLVVYARKEIVVPAILALWWLPFVVAGVRCGRNGLNQPG